MHKNLLRVTARLVVLCALISTLSIVVVYGWDDNMYFDAFGPCYENYFTVLDECRDSPGFPYNPDEPECRYYSANDFHNCLDAIPGPAFGLDFCALANSENQICIATFGPNSGNQDLSALMDCRTASGIDQCQ